MSILPQLLGAAVIALALPATGAWAESRPCAARSEVVARLAQRYGETLQSIGMHNDNRLVEVFASEATGTWTILVTGPEGTACLVAAGRMWEGVATPAPRPGRDA